MDYSQLSDFEINKRVALALGYTLYKDGHSHQSNHVVVEDGRCGAIAMEWCNNPADAWPIILKNGINVFTSMIPYGLLGQARASVISHEPPNSECIIVKDANPLRAAMIVFLMMRDEK